MNLGTIALLYLVVIIGVYIGLVWLVDFSRTTAAIIASTIGLIVIIFGAQRELENKFEFVKFGTLSFVAAFIFVASFSVAFAKRAIPYKCLESGSGMMTNNVTL